MQNAVGGEAVISFVQQQRAGICFTGCLAKGDYDTGLLASKVLMSRLIQIILQFHAMGSFPPSKRGSLQERGCQEVKEAVEGGEKGQLDGKPAGTRIGQGRKMPHADLIHICQILHAFISLSIVFGFPNIFSHFCQLRAINVLSRKSYHNRNGGRRFVIHDYCLALSLTDQLPLIAQSPFLGSLTLLRACKGPEANSFASG